MLSIIILVYSFSSPCYCTPVSIDVKTSTVGWVDDPDGRGTAGLIVSCVATLGLCVWSAMHLNIPPKGETQTQHWLRSLKWIMLGVLIPELVILSAWRQWLSARQLNKEIQKIFKEKRLQGMTLRRHQWTITHSYYAGMGGFVFDKDFLARGDDTLYHNPERLTLTASGVILLAKCGHLPDIDEEDIKDKSKADGLSKFVVCVQAAWMIVQVLGRLIARQPITLLEVNTVGHIFCAFVIYILWWKKPKEAYAPTILKGSWTDPLVSYMFMSSRVSGIKPSGFITLNQWIKTELSELAWYPSGAHTDSHNNCQGAMSTTARQTSEASSHQPAMSESACSFNALPENGSAQINIDESFPDGELRYRPVHTLSAIPTTVVKLKTTRSSGTDGTRSRRLEACNTAIRTYPAIQALLQHEPSLSSDPAVVPLKPEAAHLVTDVATDWPSDYYLPGISSKYMGMALWMSSSLYGGIHLAAWTDYFPTDAERLLWRFSGGFIVGSGVFWFVMCAVGLRWNWANEYWHRFVQLRAWKIEYAILGLGATACGLAYIFSRVFLVVDAVVSLRQLPSSAYETPDWTTVFPHL